MSEVGTQLKLKQGFTQPMCGNWSDPSTRHESSMLIEAFSLTATGLGLWD